VVGRAAGLLCATLPSSSFLAQVFAPFIFRLANAVIVSSLRKANGELYRRVASHRTVYERLHAKTQAMLSPSQSTPPD